MIDLLLLGACSVLAGLVITNWLKGCLLARYPTKSAKSPRLTRPPAAKGPSAPNLAPNRIIVAGRNIFCSTCKPTTGKGQETRTIASLDRATLLATFVTDDPRWAMATIRLLQPPRVRMMRVGDRIMGAELTEVETRRVEFRLDEQTRHLELLKLSNKDRRRRRHKMRRRRRRRVPTQRSPSGIRKTGPYRYTISRKTVDGYLANPLMAARGVRIVPHIRNGRPHGVQLRRLRRNSIYHKMGLRSGDIVRAINNQDIGSPDKALELYMKLRGASHFTVSIIRRNRPLSLDYTIR